MLSQLVITYINLVITNIDESHFFLTEMHPLTLTPRDMNEKFIITGKECAEHRQDFGVLHRNERMIHG